MSHFVVLQTVGKHGIKISSTKFFCSNFEGGFSIACLVKHAKRSEYLSTGSMVVVSGSNKGSSVVVGAGLGGVLGQAKK